MTTLALPSGRIATLRQRNGGSSGPRTREWPITGDDVLWMGRMLVAEDGFYASNPEKGYRVGRVMASMLVRRLAVMMFSGPYTSVTHLMRGDPSGDRDKPRGWSQPIRYYGLFHDSEQLKAMYRRHQARTWEEIPDYYKRAAIDTLSGRVPLLLPGVVDAAAPAFTQRKLDSGDYPDWRREHPTEARSYLISTGRSRSWPEPEVIPAGAVPGGLTGAVVGLLLLGVIAWKVSP